MEAPPPNHPIPTVIGSPLSTTPFYLKPRPTSAIAYDCWASHLAEEPHTISSGRVRRDAEEIVQAAFKAQVRDLGGHPDSGGTSDRFRKLKAAREKMIAESN